MAGIVTIREEYLTDIADAIREQTDSEMPLTTDAMAPAIRSIERGGANVDLSDYATIEYVDQRIAEIPGSDINLDDYATKEYVETFHSENAPYVPVADGQTIIDNGGLLRTAIGGYEYYAEVPPPLVWSLDREITPEEGKFYIPELTGVLPDQMMPVQYRIRVSEWVDMIGDYTWESDATLIMGELTIANNSISVLGNRIVNLSSNPNISLKSEDWENHAPCCIRYIEIFEFVGGGTELVVSPIEPRFIPVDNRTLFNNGNEITADPLRDELINGLSDQDARLNDLQSQIDDIRNSGGGGSANIDNKTIIEQDGVLRTAIGGYYTDGGPGEIAYEYNDGELSPIFETVATDSGEFTAYFALPNWTPLGEEWAGKELTFRFIEMPTPIDGESEYVFDEAVFDGVTIYLNNGSSMVADIIDNATGYVMCQPHVADNITDYENGRIYGISLGVAASGGYTPIDVNFIPIDNATLSIEGSTINANPLRDMIYENQTMISDIFIQIDEIRNNGGSGGVSEDRVNELINEALGVIENGTY